MAGACVAIKQKVIGAQHRSIMLLIARPVLPKAAVVSTAREVSDDVARRTALVVSKHDGMALFMHELRQEVRTKATFMADT